MAAPIASGARDAGRGLLDILLPPMAHDSREATASAGLTPDAWSRVVFLEAPVCDGCGAAFEYDGGDFASDRCLACKVQPYAFARARAACVYDEASRGLILKFKHGDQQQFAPLFARWIARSAADVVAEADAVVPVPLHRSRLLTRRFNQAAEVARPLAGALRVAIAPRLLQRVRETPAQSNAAPGERKKNVRGAFGVNAAGDVRGRHVGVVDDVMSSGHTLDEVATVLKRAGAARVTNFVFARTPPHA